MRSILLILLIASSITSSAQKIRFSDNRNQWETYGGVGIDGCYFNDMYYFGGDTVMSLHTYKQMLLFVMPPYLGCFGGVNGYWIREDTMANLVYYCNPSVDTQDHILYNYNLRVGDSITYIISGGLIDTVIDTVVAIDSVISDGFYYKVFTMRSPNIDRAYTLIEGIGTTNDPLWPTFSLGCFENSEALTCFRQDTFSPKIKVAYGMCAVGDSFDNCGYLSTNKIQKVSSFLRLYPNPASTALTITSPNTITQITITNLLGQTIYSNQYNAEQVQVDVSGFAAGVYFGKVNGVEVRKFVKE